MYWNRNSHSTPKIIPEARGLQRRQVKAGNKFERPLEHCSVPIPAPKSERTPDWTSECVRRVKSQEATNADDPEMHRQDQLDREWR